MLSMPRELVVLSAALVVIAFASGLSRAVPAAYAPIAVFCVVVIIWAIAFIVGKLSDVRLGRVIWGLGCVAGAAAATVSLSVSYALTVLGSAISVLGIALLVKECGHFTSPSSASSPE